MRFAYPLTLIFLLLFPPLIRLFWLKSRKRGGSVLFSSLLLLRERGENRFLSSFYGTMLGLRFVILALLILAMARPQSGLSAAEITAEGIDMMMALDISGSMKALDFQPHDRLKVAKEEASRFVDGRQHDRIGLVVFSKESFTQCPLTSDYGMLLKLLDRVQIGMIEDGTAIGMGLATSVNRLRASEAKSKVIILLTDGVNNAGKIDPLTAAKLAQTMKIRVYTIGIGKQGTAPYPVDDPVFGTRYVQMETQIDEDVLQQIAQLTGGRYFRAKDKDSLRKIYQEIDALEKSKVSVKNWTEYRELFPVFAIPALILLVLEIVLQQTRMRKLP
ncbi:MAG: VWA domain-containing protein [Candidatus Omnitrophica bacterium]|nr:VWA domain-containing protein [Candidatus Omnitrophota bacterium]